MIAHPLGSQPEEEESEDESPAEEALPSPAQQRLQQHAAPAPESRVDRAGAFRRELAAERINLRELRQLAFQGIPEDKGLRAAVWRCLLNYLPPERAAWPKALARKRAEYQQFCEVGEEGVRPAARGRAAPLAPPARAAQRLGTPRTPTDTARMGDGCMALRALHGLHPSWKACGAPCLWVHAPTWSRDGIPRRSFLCPCDGWSVHCSAWQCRCGCCCRRPAAGPDHRPQEVQCPRRAPPGAGVGAQPAAAGLLRGPGGRAAAPAAGPRRPPAEHRRQQQVGGQARAAAGLGRDWPRLQQRLSAAAPQGARLGQMWHSSGCGSQARSQASCSWAEGLVPVLPKQTSHGWHPGPVLWPALPSRVYSPMPGACRWKAYFADAEVQDQIERDIQRTHPDMHFFGGAGAAAAAHRVEMQRALFVFAKLNPGIRYVQVGGWAGVSPPGVWWGACVEGMEGGGGGGTRCSPSPSSTLGFEVRAGHERAAGAALLPLRHRCGSQEGAAPQPAGGARGAAPPARPRASSTHAHGRILSFFLTHLLSFLLFCFLISFLSSLFLRRRPRRGGRRGRRGRRLLLLRRPHGRVPGPLLQAAGA